MLLGLTILTTILVLDHNKGEKSWMTKQCLYT